MWGDAELAILIQKIYIFKTTIILCCLLNVTAVRLFKYFVDIS